MERKIPSSQTHAQEQLHNDNVANYFLNILCQSFIISKFKKKTQPVGKDENEGQKWKKIVLAILNIEVAFSIMIYEIPAIQE